MIPMNIPANYLMEDYSAGHLIGLYPTGVYPILWAVARKQCNPGAM